MDLGEGADLRGGRKMMSARRERESGGARVVVDPAVCVVVARERDWLDAKGGERGMLDLFYQMMTHV